MGGGAPGDSLQNLENAPGITATIRGSVVTGVAW